jgi:hypothetical protein
MLHQESTLHSLLLAVLIMENIKRGIFLDFSFLYVRYSTLLHLPPLRINCVRGCWDRTQNNCELRLRHWLSDALITRLDLIHTRQNLIHTRQNLIHTRLDLLHTRLDLIHTRLDLIHSRLDLIHSRLDLIHSRLNLIHVVVKTRWQFQKWNGHYSIKLINFRSLGRWVAKLGRWLTRVSSGDGWLSWEQACLLRQLSGFESRHLSKIQNGRHQQRSGQHTPASQKNIQKKNS